jgi:hypothetical protein
LTLFVGYGSLLSARGLGPSLAGVRDARLLHLRCVRRFGKPPQKGGRLAMEVVSQRATFAARLFDPAAPTPPEPGCCGALLLDMAPEAEARLVRREGFDPSCWARLCEQAPEGPAEFLAKIAQEAGDDPLSYRRALWERAGATTWSAVHYLPHPVRLDDGRAALVFVAPEPRETGHPELPSCKEAHPGLEPAKLDRLYQVGPGGISDWTASKQDHYVELCLLSIAHGVFLGDLPGAGLAPGHPTRALLAEWYRNPSALELERAAFQRSIPALSAQGYSARFAPDLARGWEWSGLAALTRP